MVRRLLLAVIAAGLSVGCLLTTDLDELHGGPAPSDGGGAGSLESGTPPTLTNPGDGGNASDAGDSDGTIPDDPNLLFRDDFNRADGIVGNGWIDARNRYRLGGGRVGFNAGDFGFTTDYLYRPEQALDVKASVEFIPSSIPPQFPQIHLRARPAKERCYALGIPLNDYYFYGRCGPSGNFDEMNRVGLTEGFQVGHTYRLTFSAKGTKPVHLEISIEHFDNGAWKAIGGNGEDDLGDSPVTEPGQYGLSANSIPNWTYDNFLATKL